jgi:hypothetical protein
MSGADALIVRLDAPVPARLATGHGQVLYLTGRCYHPERALRTLAITVDGLSHSVPNHSLLRPDVPSDDPAIGDGTPNSLTSGFWAALPLVGHAGPSVVELSWRAELDDGSIRTAALGTLALDAGDVSAPTSPPASTAAPSAAEPRVAICLAAYQPDPRFFTEQIASIRAQTHRNWCCIVSDDSSGPDALAAMRAVLGNDPRFRVVAHEIRLGHYGNFARALAEVPRMRSSSRSPTRTTSGTRTSWRERWRLSSRTPRWCTATWTSSRPMVHAPLRRTGPPGATTTPISRA